ncbi:hypothetical protein NPIL_188061 [Nephila pilipes]|uniref:Uncharacterized protein n=1 Tax=Nephila pilipes TaxID=299642 RepID=A0A8X6QXB8_NEPPI|nr:hypothetical protein NPIL_188061 [Nephila pilipes]
MNGRPISRFIAAKDSVAVLLHKDLKSSHMRLLIGEIVYGVLGVQRFGQIIRMKRQYQSIGQDLAQLKVLGSFQRRKFHNCQHCQKTFQSKEKFQSLNDSSEVKEICKIW